MLIHEGDTRTLSHDLSLAAALAFIAGGVNSAGFVAFGFLSANMTGNISMLSDHLASGSLRLAFGFALIVSTFVMGAFAAVASIQAGKRRGVSNIYSRTMIAEAALLLAAAGLTTLNVGGVAIVGILACAMGVQNAASTRISGSRIRTTHLSGVLTDIGVGLALLLEGSSEQRKRLATYVCTVAAFLGGGIFGVVAGSWSLPVCAILLVVLAAFNRPSDQARYP